MSPALAAASALAAEIAELSSERGRRVDLDPAQVLDRSGAVQLQPPCIWSPNRSCRLVEAADGWITVNLPRPSDRWSVPAWTGCDLDADPWAAVKAAARTRPWRDLVDDARRLALPVAGVGEVAWDTLRASWAPLGHPSAATDRTLMVVDMSSLWAGPLCGAVFAAMGAQVVKVESRTRPDVVRTSAPAFFEKLNRGKVELALDLASDADLERLRRHIREADVLVTGARRRALDSLGLAVERVFQDNPRLVWAAITGYGFLGEDADRVAFGDDAAAAGGLVRWTRRGEPNFLGDALADPLTGLAAAAGALRALKAGGGRLVDAAMSKVAAAAPTAAALELA